MKILGVGVDIIDNLRIEKSLKKQTFIKRIYTINEIVTSAKIKNKVTYYAKRFAAKEALSKSIGTGFRDDFNFKDISIINDKKGKPTFILSEKLKKLIKKKFNVASFNLFLSISDEKKYSIAYVILQKK